MLISLIVMTSSSVRTTLFIFEWLQCFQCYQHTTMTCQWQWTYTRVKLSYISHIAAIDVLYMKHGSLSRATKQQYTYEIGCSGTWLQEHTNNNNNKSMWVGWYATTSMHTNAYIAYIRIHRCAQFPKGIPPMYAQFGGAYTSAWVQKLWSCSFSRSRKQKVMVSIRI